jgi:TonB family protein
MFERSSSWQRFGGESQKVLKMHLGYVPELDSDDTDEKRGLRLAIGAAVVAHLVFFLLQFPAARAVLRPAGPAKPVYIVKQVRFSPPPPKAEQLLPEKKEKKRVIPIPDPTPEEPEPIRLSEVEAPDIDVALDGVVFGIPDAPPSDGPLGPVHQLTGDITPPEKIYYPSPRYTEEGRQARIQGVVILEAVVDAVGDVSRVKILKGLPFGLSEEAAATARQWKFRPAKKAGKPVSVFLNLTIRFSLQ